MSPPIGRGGDSSSQSQPVTAQTSLATSGAEPSAAFTPGPWHTCGDQCSCGVIMCADHPVAKVISGDWGDDYPALRVTGPSLDQKVEAYMEQITYGHLDPDVARANANLIAAAPDLFGLLREVRDACLYPEDDDEIGITEEPTIDADLFGRICAALRKAEGRQ